MEENFWNDLGGETDNDVFSFDANNQVETEAGQQEQEAPESLQSPPETATPAVNPLEEKLAALEARYAQLQAQVEQGRQQPQQPVSAPPVQQQPQQFQYAPQRVLNDADLAQYHHQVTSEVMRAQQAQAQMLNNIRVEYEKQGLQATKQTLQSSIPDLFKYVDESKVDQIFQEELQRGNFGIDWKTRIEAAYKISSHEDLKKAASELEAARQVKAAKQAKAMKAVTPGGTPYQPAANQPAAGNVRGFKGAHSGFLADLGLG